MTWHITYHKDVESDLKAIGSFAAKRILRAIDAKLTKAPLDFGQPLTGNLARLRKLRVSDYRIVYTVSNNKVIVYVLAVGPRRDKEIYTTAGMRT